MSRTARVTFSYVAEEEDELSLDVGDIITNIVDVDVGWCEGELNGKKGLFPDHFVEEVVAPDSSSDSEEATPRNEHVDGLIDEEENVPLRNPARPWSGDIHTSAPCEYSESIALRLKRGPRFRNRANRSRRHLRGKGAGGTDAGPSAATAAGSTTGGSLARADNTPTNRIPDDDLTMYLPDPPGFRWLSKGEDESKTGKANVHEEDLKLSDESQKPTDTEVTVPSEIQARAQLAYIDVLKNGKVKVYRTRIMLLGQDRAGKTSLKKSFLGLPFDHGEPSTDGITIDQSKFEINVDQVKNWVQTGEKPFVSQFANDLAKMVADKLKNEQAVVEVDQVMTVEQIDENEDVPQSANDFAKILTEQAEGGDEDNFEDQYRRKKAPNRDETATNVATDVSTVQEESEGKEAIICDPALPPEEFTQFLVQHWQGLSLQSEVASIENYMTLDLWDFAGQHLYYSSYPVFLSSRAVYMLVYNMSKDLQCTAEPCVRVGNVDSHLKNPNGETNLENLLSWLRTVVTMCAGQPTANYVRPPVFIVGTHADQPCQDIKEMESHIKMALYGNDLDHHVIREGVIQNYFSVDNRLGSSCSGVRTLQKKIIEVLKQEPYMGEEVPARQVQLPVPRRLTQAIGLL